MTAIATTTTIDGCTSVLARLGRRLYALGHLPATSGNLSLRMDRDSCAITASGRDKGSLGAGDVVRVSFSGSARATGGVLTSEAPLLPGAAAMPSAEALLHTTLYQRFPDAGAVLHTHCRMATVLSRLRCDEDALVFENYELGKAFRGVSDSASRLVVPIFDNHSDITELAARTRRYFDSEPRGPCFGYVLRSHGLYAWGADAEEAFRHHEALQYLVRCELDLHQYRRRESKGPVMAEV